MYILGIRAGHAAEEGGGQRQEQENRREMERESRAGKD